MNGVDYKQEKWDSLSNVRVAILAEVVQNKFDNTNEKMTFTPPSATAETQNLSIRILSGKIYWLTTEEGVKNLFSNFGICHFDIYLRSGQSVFNDSILKAKR